MISIIGGTVSSVKGYGKKIVDTFTRSNQTLDRSSDGTKWNILRGTWSIVSNKLSSSDSPSTYPIATVNTTSSNVDFSIKDMSQGTTAALWVTDSGNWWGLGIDQETNTSCTCQTCTDTNYAPYYYYCGDNYCTGANYYYCCNVVGNRYCKNYYGNCYRWASAPYRCTAWYSAGCNYNSGWCNEANTSCVGGYYTYDCGDNYCLGYYVSGYYSYSCNCTTCYPQYVRLIRSVANTVSTIVSNFIGNSSVIKSLMMLIRGNQITAKVYSNTDLTGQIGSDLVYTPTGVAITPKYGIMVKPSSYSQGTTAGEIQIENK